MRTKPHKRVSIALLLSITFHAVVGVVLVFMEHKKTRETKAPVVVEWVELKDESIEATKNVQIVEQNKSMNNKTPQDNYRLSQSNQDVHQETKAQAVGNFQNKANKKIGSQASSKKVSSTSTAKASSRQALLDSLKPEGLSATYKPEPPQEHAAEQSNEGGEISQTDDHLQDVVASAETLLRTREFVYYSYYTRIKGKLKQHWEPRIKDKIVKILRQGRRIASVNNQITRLVITLDAQGELIRIQVRNASGYNDLDDAAIEAFRAAAPFPNPPDGLMNKLGQVEINWDFVLET